MPGITLGDGERILVVDDDPDTLRILRRILERGNYVTETAADTASARAALQGEPFDLIVCDVELPDGSGLALVEDTLARFPATGAVMISGLDDVELAERALAAGAYGYIVKPFTANDVHMRVLGALTHRRREQSALDRLRASQEETVRRLAIAIEARDSDTAQHVNRMSELCGRIARTLGVDGERTELIRTASTMHDVGKIAIADRILLKPGPLTDEERSEMQRHAEVGYRILSGSSAELLQVAATIAWTHHEHWDGGGYPRGLAGSDIPLEGRIAAVADVYDALTRDRVYRTRLRGEEAAGFIADRRGRQFDPDAVDGLMASLAA